MKIYHVKAFCKEEKGGNPAGVILNADWISQIEMQNIAKAINYSESAFVLKSDIADYNVKFFTPASEVDLCGHATIATFHVLFNQNFIGPGHYTQETLAGKLGIDIDNKGTIFMEQPLPKEFGLLAIEEISKSLGLHTDDIIGPIEIISTGFKDAIIHVKDSITLKNLNPNFKSIKEICEKYNFGGYHVFTTDTKPPYKARCRNFAPLYDIDEEAATGTASGALTAYMIGHLDTNLEEGVYEWVYEQGVEMNQASRIDVKFKINNHKLSKLNVGGKAIIYDSKITD